jgi:threonyl-tRNA synthetase
VRILTISEKVDAFAEEIYAQLKDAGLRVSLNNDADKIGAKIRLAQLDRIPYMLVLGEKEAAAQCVAVRHSKKGDLGVKPIADFLAEIQAEVRERRL